MAKEDTQELDSDEIIPALADMLKAEPDEDSDTVLSKANGDSEDDSDDDDYDEKYMKRHMKRYMKSNKSDVMKYMKSMKKAVDHEVESAESEIADAEAVLINGTDMYKASQEMSEKFVSVLESLVPEVKFLTQLQKAQGNVILQMSEQIEEMGKTPQPRKGVQSAGDESFVKAQTVQTDDNQNTKLQKAAEYMQSHGFGDLKRMVMKAMKNGDQAAGSHLSYLEMSGGNLTLLPPTTQKFVADLISAEGNGG